MKQSGGILAYRRNNGSVEVLLVHPGGPFWAKKDLKAWGLPKGEFKEDEEPFLVAKREFEEEIGIQAPEGEYIELGTVKTSSKLIYGWAVEADLDATNIKSNPVTLEWPPKSGQTIEFPEVDKAQWFEIGKAGPKMHTGQEEFLERLADRLDVELAKPEQASLF